MREPKPMPGAREQPGLSSFLYMPLITLPIRILVVEDETFIRMDAVEMLGAAGFDILEAANADEAIQMLERDIDIRLLFTDIDMPGSMNGLKLAAAVSDRWPRSASSRLQDISKCRPAIFRQVPGSSASPTNRRKL